MGGGSSDPGSILIRLRGDGDVDLVLLVGDLVRRLVGGVLRLSALESGVTGGDFLFPFFVLDGDFVGDGESAAIPNSAVPFNGAGADEDCCLPPPAPLAKYLDVLLSSAIPV